MITDIGVVFTANAIHVRKGKIELSEVVTVFCFGKIND